MRLEDYKLHHADKITEIGSAVHICAAGNSDQQVFLDTGANTSSETMFQCRS